MYVVSQNDNEALWLPPPSIPHGRQLIGFSVFLTCGNNLEFISLQKFIFDGCFDNVSLISVHLI